MNKFKLYLVLSALPLSFTTAISAQPVAPQELRAMIRDISQRATALGNELSDGLQPIDLDALTRGAEQLALLSEQYAGDITNELEQLGGMAPLIYQKEKTSEYTYPINSRQSVNIDNRYGKITINNWAKKEVKVIVTLRTAESSERRAEEALDRVRIDQSRSGSAISFKTGIESGDSNWWSQLTSGTGDRTLRVDYDVYLPKNNELVLANRYGAIELADRDGRVDVSVSYGSLRAGRLNGSGNSLSVAYSKADVEYLNEGDVSVRYGGFTLAEAEKLTLAMNYSSGGEIGKINQRANISLRYSSGFEMGLGPALQKASIAAAYSSIRVRPSKDAAFNFDVAVRYGGFDYDHRHVHIGSKSESNTAATYAGYWNRTSDNVVSISARYGAVSLK